MATHNKLVTVDVSDPTNLIQLGSADAGFFQSRGVTVKDNIAYFADEGKGLLTIDVTDPEQPIYLNWVKKSIGAKDVEVVDGIAYIANDSKGVVLVDVNDPANPVFLGSADAIGFGGGIDVANGDIYFASTFGGLHIYEYEPSSFRPTLFERWGFGER